MKSLLQCIFQLTLKTIQFISDYSQLQSLSIKSSSSLPTERLPLTSKCAAQQQVENKFEKPEIPRHRTSCLRKMSGCMFEADLES